MAIIKEEITAALGNPEAAEYKILFEALTEKEFTALPKSDIQKFYSDERERNISKITAEIYSGLDKDIMDVSGLKKNPDEKTYDFAKRVISSYKEGKTTHEAKIQELEQKIKEGSQDKTLISQIEALKAKQIEFEKEKEQLSQSLFQKDINIEIKDSLRGLPSFRKDIPESIVKMSVDVITNQLINSAQVEKGKIVFVENDRVLLDDKANPASAAYLLKERLKDVLDNGRQQQGSGSGGSSDGKNNAFTRLTAVPSGIETRGQLMDDMANRGYVKGTKEYNEDFLKFSTGLRLR